MATPKGIMPGAKYRPVSYAKEAGRFPLLGKRKGWILHVVVGDGSPWATFERAKSPRRRFSHFWVNKQGEIEQYQPITHKSWAQKGGNTDYYSVETEGYPSQPLTKLQLEALGRIHNYLGTEDRIAHKPGERGIGTHFMGKAAYGAHSCPDPEGREGKGPRSLQRDEIIAAAKRQRVGKHAAKKLTPAQAAWAVKVRERYDVDGDGLFETRTVATMLAETHATALRNGDVIAVLRAEVSASRAELAAAESRLTREIQALREALRAP